jgi:hypothetical protein
MKSKSKLDSPSVMMLAEKVQGQNILDFLTSERYLAASPEEKGSFFFKAGLISMLDLVLGNFERFVAINPVKPGFLSVKLPANLGNAFIVSEIDSMSNRHFNFVAIDNGIAPRLTIQTDDRLEWTSKEVRERYDLFLQKMVSDHKGIERLVSNIIHSFKIYPTVMPSATPLLDPFLTDLENPEICRNQIKEGLLQMGSVMKKVIIPYWNSPKSANLKAEISQNFAGALKPLDERLGIFNHNFLIREE